MKNKLQYILVLVAISMQLLAQNPPEINGKILYHTYSDYGAWDAEMFILDLSDNSIENISSEWNIDHEMNGVFSPDGSMIVFMGDQAGRNKDWDIFLWTVGGGEPVNLTEGDGTRDEDPKFSPDGTKIVFKRSGDIMIMDLQGNILSNVTNTPTIEESMPIYTSDGQKILFAPGVGDDSDIYIVDIDGNNRQALVEQSNYQEYFPITRDNESFFYTGWISSTDVHDQLFLKYYSSEEPIHLPFNSTDGDYSDAWPVGTDYVLCSSTRPGGKGGYDLYIADIETGDIWSLDEYNTALNDNFENLGANYFAGTPPANYAPSVGVVSPLEGTSFSAPASILIEVDASDTDGNVVKVEFFQNGNLLGEDNSEPYTYTWNDVVEGDYLLTAIATDNEGAMTTSEGVNIHVITGIVNNAPVVNISSPADGTTYLEPASIVIEADATDSDGEIIKVEFYQNGNLLSEDITAPYSYNWNSVSVGTYSITVVATDDLGLSTTSDPVVLSVNTEEGCVSHSIPGIIEAEDYCDMFGVVEEQCTDEGGGLDLGGIVADDWVEYLVDVASTGDYSVTYRIASKQSGGEIQFLLDGVELASTVLPRTGDWQAWESVTETVYLTAGIHTIKLVDVNRSWNINWISLYEVSAKKGSNIVEIDEESEMNFYPNPVGNILYINIGSEDKSCNIKIYDLSGKLQLQKTNFNGNTIDVSLLKSGEYILLYNNKKSRKLIKK